MLAAGAASAVLLWSGLAGLFFPAVQGVPALTAWALCLLVLTSLAYSQIGIAHQAWGARLGGDELHRSRIVAWREGAALVGVVLASLLPTLLGLPVMLGVFAAALLLGWWAWTRAPRPSSAALQTPVPRAALWHPWRQAPFRRLMVVFLLNGIASAIPATLVLFFVQDRLQAPPAQEPWFLGSYFVCAALSIPLWLRAVARWGLARTWLAGMLLAVAVFLWAAALGAGDGLPFLAVCALSGVALGTDLALPGALLAGVVDRQGDRDRHEGVYFGWWNLASKLNLALAAGLALPLLDVLGYTPGTRDPAALHTLGLAYALLPCTLKLLAAAGLYLLILRPSTPADPPATPLIRRTP